MLVQVQNLRKRLTTPTGERTILDGVDLNVSPGEVIAVTGASGSGKTTLLTIVAGLDRSYSGDVSVCGVRMADRTERQRAQLRNRKLGFVFQSFHLLDDLQVLENVTLPLRFDRGQSWDSRTARDAGLAALSRVGLRDRADDSVSGLSGGERQRVAIARAVVQKPSLLLADEPTGNLDPGNATRIEELFLDLASEGELHCGILIATHKESLAARAQRKYLLEKGRLSITKGDAV